MNEPSKDIRKIPTHLELGSHNKRSTDALNVLGNKINSILETSTEGKVLVLVERADFSMPDSAFTTMGVNQGLLPSEAFAQTEFIAQYGRGPADYGELNLWMIKNPPKDGFFKKELEVLDDLTERYPGRIYLLPEWSPEEELEKIDKEGDKKIIQLAHDGKFDEAIPLLRNSLEKMAESVKSREPRLIQSIKEDLEGEEDILAVVGHLGATHTGVYYELIKENFSVERNFPQKYGKKYYYDPYAAALRQMLFFPEKKFSDNDWHKLLILVTIYAELDAMTDDPIKDQRNIEMLWNEARNFTPEEIKLFEQRAKEVGFIEALENFSPTE